MTFKSRTNFYRIKICALPEIVFNFAAIRTKLKR